MTSRTKSTDYDGDTNNGDTNFELISRVVDSDRRDTNSEQILKRHVHEQDTDEQAKSKRVRDTEDEGSDLEESDSSSDGTEDEISNNEIMQLSESVFIYPNRKMSDHGNVFEGEIRSEVYGVRVCAIKIDRKSEHIVREAKILTKLSSHTHVLSIIQSGIYKNMFEEHVYLALDKCHKQNLHQHIAHQNESGLGFNLNESLEYCKQIIAGLTYIHENLIIHKDLKPSNILLSHDKSTIKLADFGLSQKIKSVSTKVYNKNQFGTNGFRPIESFGNNWVSLKTDTFSLGVVLYFVLSNGKSPFGDETCLWTYNIQNGVVDLTHLLLANSNTFQHLIKLLLDKERCRRPSIGQVSQHPCWTEKDIDCNFDYGFTEENDDADVKMSVEWSHDTFDAESEMDNRRQLLAALHKMGYNVYAYPDTSIIIFDRTSQNLLRFNLKTKSVTQLHEFHDGMKVFFEYEDSDSESGSFSSHININNRFSSVSLGEHIYILQACLLYRLKHTDDTVTWDEMKPPDVYQGPQPAATVVSGSIYVVGIGGIQTEYANPATGANTLIISKSISKYDPLLNIWEHLQDKNLATSCATAIASKECVYCIGGYTHVHATNRVERFNVVSQTWDEIAQMRQARGDASAVVCNGEFFVAGGKTLWCFYHTLNSVEKYDPIANQWTVMQPMIECCYELRIHFIEGSIYAVGGRSANESLIGEPRTTIEKYDFGKNKWEIFHDLGKNLNICDSVVVNSKNKN